MDITMNFRKSTKNTHVFDEVVGIDNDRLEEIIPTLYIRKSAFPNKVPVTIKVTVKVVE